MRLRDVLIALVDEAEIDHWNGADGVWRHHPEDCETCRSAIAAQAVLEIKFLDFQHGDKVRVGHDSSGVFGLVVNVALVVNVKLGYATAAGVHTYAGAPVVHVDAAELTRIE